MTKPIATDWFAVEPAGDGLLRIREAHIDPYYSGNIWLARGRKYDLLIDTGTGIHPLRPFLSTVTDKPITAVALNCFYDHAGGLHEFGERLAHEADADAIEQPTGESSVADEFVSDDMLLALPYDGYTTESYAMSPASITRRLRDGDIIDLGNRIFEVLHTPLQTPGSVCLWEAATGALFTSDVMLMEPDGLDLKPRYPEHFDATMARLLALPIETIHGGHYDSFGRAPLDRAVAEFRAGQAVG